MQAETIPGRLFEQARLRPEAPAYLVRRQGRWEATSWRGYARHVMDAARALLALGVDAGDAVAILSGGRPEWVILDVAAMAIGAVPVGVYATCSAPEVRHVLEHASVKLALVEDAAQWEKLRQAREGLPDLAHVVLIEEGAGAPDAAAPDADPLADPMTRGWAAFMASGAEVEPGAVEARLDALDEASLATLIYTSGTTGQPRGVMLSHHNLAWTAQLARSITNARSDDSVLSYLPLSHIAEQMFTIHGSITTGYAVYFAESLERLPENLREARPTLLFGVPRVWEKLHAGIVGRVAGLGSARQWAFARAIETGAAHARYLLRGERPPVDVELRYRLAERLVIRKLRAALGLDRVRLAMSGAAPIATSVQTFFSALGLILYEVYGQSEGSGPTSCTLPGAVRFGTVGRPVPGVSVQLAADGEVMVRGDNVFMGYHRDPEATAAALHDGWLLSGDLGSFDGEGFLSITGRKKELLITSGGKNIAPSPIERALKSDPLIDEAVVIGDRRKHLSVLLVLNEDAARAVLRRDGDRDGDRDAPRDAPPPHTSPAVRSAAQAAIDRVNLAFARVEQLKRFAILPRALSVEAGELTPSLKVRRHIVEQRYASMIEALYA